MANINKFDHDKHARTKDEKDFWGQIRRTVQGKAVEEGQINMIVDRITEQLSFQKSDSLLDLACGNGALASRIFNLIDSYTGVDFSKTLIEIANKYFASPPDYSFVHSDASEYVDKLPKNSNFNKLLCYGSFSYFSDDSAVDILQKVFNYHPLVSHFFIGNLPDRDLAAEFYGSKNINQEELSDHESPIGIWRSSDEFVELAISCGWQAELSRMPDNYYASHYRYDVLLTRSQA